MNHGQILGRAWTLVRHSRALWVFGFLFALAGGGGGFQSAQRFSSGGSRSSTTGGFPHLPLSQINWALVTQIAVAVLVALLVLGVLVAIVRYLSETALMAASAPSTSSATSTATAIWVTRAQLICDSGRCGKPPVVLERLPPLLKRCAD